MPQIYDPVLDQWIESETGETTQTEGSRTPPAEPPVEQPSETQQEEPSGEPSGETEQQRRSREAYGGTLPFEVPKPVSDDRAKSLASQKPSENKDATDLSGEDAKTLQDINRRMIAGETLTDAEKEAAKEWLPGSYNQYEIDNPSEQKQEEISSGVVSSVKPYKPVTPEELRAKGISLSLNPNEPYVLPDGAKVIRTDANGNPIAYEFEGEIYYPPGSLPFESGFRTESDRVKYGGEHTEGIYHGNRVRPDSVFVVDESGNPIARYGSDALARGELNADLGMGLVRFPVKNTDGMEVLLTQEQYNKLSNAETNEERLSAYKAFGLVPETMTLKQFTGEQYKDDLAKANAEAFVFQQDRKRFEEITLPTLPDWIQEAYRKRGFEGYNEAILSLSTTPVNAPKIDTLNINTEQSKQFSDLLGDKALRIRDTSVKMSPYGTPPTYKTTYDLISFFRELPKDLPTIEAAMAWLKTQNFKDADIAESRDKALRTQTTIGGEVAPKPKWYETVELNIEKNLEEFKQGSIESSQSITNPMLRDAALGLGGSASTLVSGFISLPISVAHMVGKPQDIPKISQSIVRSVGDSVKGLYQASTGRQSLNAWDIGASTAVVVMTTDMVGNIVAKPLITYLSPETLPASLIGKEYSTGRIPIKDIDPVALGQAVFEAEKQAMTPSGSLSGKVPIGDTGYSLKYLKPAFQEKVGNVVWHGSTEGVEFAKPTIKIGEGVYGFEAGKSGLYTNPYAALGFAKGDNGALLMILSDTKLLKSTPEAVLENISQSGSFIRDAKEGIYAPSKQWRGDFETELVAAPSTKFITEIKGKGNLLTRALAGKEADFAVYAGGNFIPVKVAIDSRLKGTAKVPTATDLYSVKLLTLENSLQNFSEAVTHPHWVISDVIESAKSLVKYPETIAESRTGLPSTIAPLGVREMYIVDRLGGRLKTLARELKEEAVRILSREEKELTDLNYREALERAYARRAAQSLNAYSNLSAIYERSATDRQKFEDLYTYNLSESFSALNSRANYDSQLSRAISSDLASNRTSSYGFTEGVSSVLGRSTETGESVSTPESPSSMESITTPESPRTPDSIITPESPETIDTPRTPESPSSVDTLATPSTPITPESPETPITPRTPEIPDEPDEPIRPPEDDVRRDKVIASPPPGTLVWQQGNPQYRGSTTAPMYYVLPPPYRPEDKFVTRQTPEGYDNQGYTGKGMAKKSLQVLGGNLESPVENVDLGFARVNIRNEAGKPVIEYVKDEESNTGDRSKTVGQGRGQIPIEEWDKAKAEGIPFDEFLATYKGQLVGGANSETKVEPEAQEPKIVWVNSASEIPEDSITTAPAETTRGHYSRDTNTIYAIKGVTTPSELAHEEYHSKNQVDINSPREFVTDELRANKYAYDKTGENPDFTSTLRAIMNDLTDYSYKVEPKEALSILKEEFEKVNPPEIWREDFRQLEKEFGEVYETQNEPEAQRQETSEKAPTKHLTRWEAVRQIKEMEQEDDEIEEDYADEVLRPKSRPAIRKKVQPVPQLVGIRTYRGRILPSPDLGGAI